MGRMVWKKLILPRTWLIWREICYLANCRTLASVDYVKHGNKSAPNLGQLCRERLIALAGHN